MRTIFNQAFNVIRNTLYVILLFSSTAFAGNLVISNVSLEARNASANTVVVEFDISWEHSWRKDDGRHDATWVFVKLLDGNTGTPSYPWLHGRLYTAGTNPNDGTSSGTNNNVEIVVPSDKAGAFIRSKVTGNGTLTSQNMRLVVDYGTAGAADGDTITAKVYGIEMVYIPEGPFYIGDTNNPNGNETPGELYGNSDDFLSVFNSSGTFQWAKRLGGSGTDLGAHVATDGNNNVIVTLGAFRTVDLNGDGDTADSHETGQTGVYASWDVVISVFNSSGTFQWSERLGGTSTDVGSPAIEANNNIIVGGGYIGNADLNGDGDTADANESTSGSFDAAVSVFSSTGIFQWSERFGGTGTDSADGVAAGNNTVMILGSIAGNADLNGDGDTGDTNETGNTGVYAGTSDVFVSVFSSAGTFQWAERLGGTRSDVGTIVTASGDAIYLAGTVERNADLNGDGDTGDSHETGQSGVYADIDMFISVFSSAGTFQWAKRLGGTIADTIITITTDGNSRVIAGGSVSGNVDLNGDGDTGDTNENASTRAFLSVFDSAGTFQWSKRFAGTSSSQVNSIATDANNNIIVFGTATGNADLNGDTDTGDANETDTGGDLFISVFNSGGAFQWSERWGSATDSTIGSVAVDENGRVVVAGGIGDSTDFNGDDVITSTFGFYQSGAEDQPVQITTTAKTITVDINGNENIDTNPMAVTGRAGITGNTAWPEGYRAFYLMKYEITQQQYRDFLNTLSRTQQGKRVGVDVSADTVTNYYVMSNTTTVSGRQGIRAPASGNGITDPVIFGVDLSDNGTFNEINDGLNIAMNWINWPDLAAYADWTGLRPMTELEYEKACRGSGTVVYGEKCWSGVSTASLALTQVTSIVNAGTSSETSGNMGGGLVVYNNHASVQGPLRVGFAATNATNRVSASAGYYGNMGLSGNLEERTVSIGNATGRAFAGTHGDGVLTTTASFEGNATNNDWPGIDGTTNKGVTGGTGTGRRGGGWDVSASFLSVADRNIATSNATGITRATGVGGRCARTAP